MHVTVTKDTCVGAAQCALSAPQVFTQDAEEGLVEVLDVSPPEAEYDNVREAEFLCPSASIQVTDDT